MRFPAVLILPALMIGILTALPIGARAQAPPPKLPAAAGPGAPSTAAPAAPSVTGADGVTLPLVVAPPAPTLPPGRVVVQVGDVQLTSLQVGQILEGYSDAQRVFVNGPGRAQFVEQLVRVLLLSQEGRKRKLDETERYRTQLNYSAAGILSSHTDEDIRKGFKIDDAMLQEYLQAHRLQYMQLRARHILIRMEGSRAPLLPGQKDLTEAEALVKAQEIRRKIVEGADFGELAKTESSDPATSATGGDLGFFKRGQMPPSFEEAAFALKIGEVSQPVKTSLGYALIKLEESKPVMTFEELRPEMEKNLRYELARKAVEDLKAKTKIEIDPEFSSSSVATTTVKPPPQ